MSRATVANKANALDVIAPRAAPTSGCYPSLTPTTMPPFGPHVEQLPDSAPLRPRNIPAVPQGGVGLAPLADLKNIEYTPSLSLGAPSKNIAGCCSGSHPLHS